MRVADEHVAVIGAGPAGLAAAWAIRRAGIDPVVIEQADSVAASWRRRHDHLRLNTHRMFSHQPGARIPRRCGPFPRRDDYVAYLQDYAAGLRLGTRFFGLDRSIYGNMHVHRRQARRLARATRPTAQPVHRVFDGPLRSSAVSVRTCRRRRPA